MWQCVCVVACGDTIVATTFAMSVVSYLAIATMCEHVCVNKYVCARVCRCV